MGTGIHYLRPKGIDMNMKRVMLALAVAVCVSSAAWAAAPSANLHLTRPNAAGVSLSPNYHAHGVVLRGGQPIQLNAAPVDCNDPASCGSH